MRDLAKCIALVAIGAGVTAVVNHRLAELQKRRRHNHILRPPEFGVARATEAEHD